MISKPILYCWLVVVVWEARMIFLIHIIMAYSTYSYHLLTYIAKIQQLFWIRRPMKFTKICTPQKLTVM